jgi:hypothetical protein
MNIPRARTAFVAQTTAEEGQLHRTRSRVAHLRGRNLPKTYSVRFGPLGFGRINTI